jgi:Zn-dependent M32 family carboxypeptidase
MNLNNSNEIYLYLNQVKPNLIRIYSDELTYPLHIILRFEIERGLFNGSIEVLKILFLINIIKGIYFL